jgi:hypothetical protein
VRHRGSPTGGGPVPRRHWKERAMILIGLIIIIAVIMIAVLARGRRKP